MLDGIGNSPLIWLLSTILIIIYKIIIIIIIIIINFQYKNKLK